MFIWVIIIVTILILFIISQLIVWYISCNENFAGYIKPGEDYKIGERSYTLPELPLVGTARVLKSSFLVKQRELLIHVTMVMKKLNIEHWLSGGTLLGFTRHKTFIPWDDDIDMHTHWKHKDYIFSHEFAKHLEPFGLEAIFHRGTSASYTTVAGGAARLRMKGSSMPICDILFVKEMSNGKIGKIDRWTDTKVEYNTKEQWDKDMIFPIRYISVDDMVLPHPNKPLETLQVQYGDKVMDKMYSVHWMVSHSYVFKALPFLFKTL